LKLSCIEYLHVHLPQKRAGESHRSPRGYSNTMLAEGTFSVSDT